MNIKAFLILLILFQYGVLWSQSSIVDSLQYQLGQTDDSQTKIEIWNELAWQLRMGKTDQALIYAKKALKVSREKSFTSQKGTAHSRLGSCHFQMGDYDSASFHHQRALEIRSMDSNFLFAANSALNLGICLNLNEQYLEALKALALADSLYIKLNIPSERLFVQVQRIIAHVEMRQLGEALELLVNCESKSQSDFPKNVNLKGELLASRARFHEMNYDYESALNVVNKSMNIFRELQLPTNLCRAWLSKGNIHYSLGQNDSCETAYRQALLALKPTDNVVLRFKVNASIMQFWLLENRLDSSLYYMGKADRLVNPLSQSAQHALFYKQKGDFYSTINDHRQAIIAYEKSVELRAHSPPIKLLETYYNMHLTYQELGQPQMALRALQKCDAMRDSLENSMIEARDLEKQLIASQHQNRLLQEERAKQQAEQKLKKTRLKFSIILTTVAISLLLAFIGYQREKNKRRLAQKDQELTQKAKNLAEKGKELAEKRQELAEKGRELAEKNQALMEEKVDAMLKKQELRSIMNVLEIQERERQRIAQDLHDRLGGMIATMKLLFQDVQNSILEVQGQLSDTFNEALGVLDKAGEEVRRVAHNLVSGPLKNLGLEAALKELANTIQHSESVSFEFISHGLKNRLSRQYEFQLYRIVQEMVSNSLKHALATEITLQLLRDNGRLNLVYEDNGVGFNIDLVEKGMGLKGIESRVDQLDGAFEIDSGKGSGTTYNITIPLKNQTDDTDINS